MVLLQRHTTCSAQMVMLTFGGHKHGGQKPVISTLVWSLPDPRKVNLPINPGSLIFSRCDMSFDTLNKVSKKGGLFSTNNAAFLSKSGKFEQDRCANRQKRSQNKFHDVLLSCSRHLLERGP